jgi:hypothetical protein
MECKDCLLGGSMLLQYALTTLPSPLQAGIPGNLTLTISNGGRQLVTVTSIVITLPVGTNAKDLTAGTGFQTVAPSGWNLAPSGGVLTLTPEAGTGPIGADAVTILIASVAVNEQPGTANLFIDETAALGGGSPVESTMSLPVAKFPIQFWLSDLVATPTQVAFGGSCSLMWNGTQADQATYTLSYLGSAGSVSVPVGNLGPYQATNLTIFPVTFSLTVSLIVPGQDQPVVVQKQANVDEIPQVAITQFLCSQQTIAGAQPPPTLQWQVQLASSVTLSLADAQGPISGTPVDVTNFSSCTVTANGTVPFVISDPSGNQIGTLMPPNPIPASLSFVLIATGLPSPTGETLVAQQPYPVTIQTPAQITSFSSNMTEDWSQGFLQKIWTLSWGTANANPVTISGIGTVGASGSQSVSPGQTYTILALGFGTQATQPLFVNG